MSTLFARSLTGIAVVTATLFVCAPQARALNCDPTYVADFQTCLSPPDVGASATTPTSITLGWAIYSGTYTLPDGFGIWRGGKLVYQKTNPNSPNTFTDTGLASKTTYTYTICAYWTVYSDEDGRSHPADPASHPNNPDPAWECEYVNYQTASAAPPPSPAPCTLVGPVSNLRIGNRFTAGLEVLWTNPACIGYYAISATVPPSFEPTAGILATPNAPVSYTITTDSITGKPLLPATLYWITVCGFVNKPSLIKGPCSQIQGRTAAPAPAPMPMPEKPKGVSAFRATASIVVVHWTAQVSEYYQVERRLVTVGVAKTMADRGVYVSDWLKVGPTIPWPKNGYSDIVNAPTTPNSHFEYRVCGWYNVLGPSGVPVCSDPVEVEAATLQLAPH